MHLVGILLTMEAVHVNCFNERPEVGILFYEASIVARINLGLLVE
jgi:hypothetical protein